MQFWVYTLMQIPAGIMVDRRGIKAPAAAGTLLTGFGALLLCLTHDYHVALASSALVGLGMSTVFMGLMKNNTLWFEPHRYGRITGITMLIASAGSIAAEGPASLLLDYMPWRHVFLFLGVATVLTGMLIGLFYREPCSATVPGRDGSAHKSSSASKTTPSHKADSTNKAKPVTKASPTNKRAGATNRATVNRAAARAKDASTASNPGAYRHIIRSRQIWLILLAIAGTNGTFYAFAGLWGGPLLIDGFGLDRSHAAWFVTAALVPYGLGSLVFGHLSDAARNRKFFVVGASAVSTVAWAVLTFGDWSPGLSGWLLYLALGFSGAQVVVSFAAVKESVPGSLAGLGLSVVNMGVFLTSAVVQLVFGWILDAVAAPEAAPGLADYRAALLLPLCLSAAGLIAALFVRETYPRD
jgi:MFS family permease